MQIYMECGHSFDDEQTVQEIDGEYVVVECAKLSPVIEVVEQHKNSDRWGAQYKAEIVEHKRDYINCIRCGTEQKWGYLP